MDADGESMIAEGGTGRKTEVNPRKEIYRNLLGPQDSLLGLRERVFRETLEFDMRCLSLTQIRDKEFWSQIELHWLVG